MKKTLLIASLLLCSHAFSQTKFAQLDQELPTPNEYRTAGGAPGHNYYQQKADYKIAITIDDATQKLTGDETITYTNNTIRMYSSLRNFNNISFFVKCIWFN